MCFQTNWKTDSFVVHGSFPVRMPINTWNDGKRLNFIEKRLQLELGLRGRDCSFWEATGVLGQEEPSILDVRAQSVGVVRGPGLEALMLGWEGTRPRLLGQEGTDRREACVCC